MHEFTIAMGIVDSLRELSSKKGLKINNFKIAIGELSMFNSSIIIDLVKELIRGTELENTNFSVVTEEAKIKCESCTHTYSFNELSKQISEEEKEMIHFIPELISSYIKCPLCSSRDLKILSGRGVKVIDIALRKQ